MNSVLKKHKKTLEKYGYQNTTNPYGKDISLYTKQANDYANNNEYINQNVALQQLQNAKSAYSQYNEMVKNNAIALAQQDAIRAQAQKYLGSNLRTAGIENVGSSEANKIGLYNNYMNNVNQQNANMQNGILNLYSNYQDSQIQNQMGLNEIKYNAMLEEKANNESNFNNAINSVTTPEQLENVLSVYGRTNDINADVYRRNIIDNAIVNYAENGENDKINSLLNRYPELVKQSGVYQNYLSQKSNIDYQDELSKATNIADRQAIIDKYRNLVDSSQISVDEEVLNEQLIAKKYGLSDEVMSNPISINTDNFLDFGKFKGSDSIYSEQNKYIEKVIESAKAGKLENGTLVNMNYGKGTPKLYLYLNGKFYDANNNLTIYSDAEKNRKEPITNKNIDLYFK